MPNEASFWCSSILEVRRRNFWKWDQQMLFKKVFAWICDTYLVNKLYSIVQISWLFWISVNWFFTKTNSVLELCIVHLYHLIQCIIFICKWLDEIKLHFNRHDSSPSWHSNKKTHKSSRRAVQCARTKCIFCKKMINKFVQTRQGQLQLARVGSFWPLESIMNTFSI